MALEDGDFEDEFTNAQRTKLKGAVADLIGDYKRLGAELVSDLTANLNRAQALYIALAAASDPNLQAKLFDVDTANMLRAQVVAVARLNIGAQLMLDTLPDLLDFINTAMLNPVDNVDFPTRESVGG